MSLWKICYSELVIKKVIGVFLIIIGLLALITPFTPGSWLIFVGLELIGLRLAFWDKIKSKFFSKNDTTPSEN